MEPISVGRTVHILHPGAEPLTGRPAWCAAIVTWVDDEETQAIRANVQLPMGGMVSVAGSVPGDEPGCWRWPPRV